MKKNGTKAFYKNRAQIVINGTEHTVTSEGNRITHRKVFSKALNLQQAPTLRGTGPKDIFGRFMRRFRLSRTGPTKTAGEIPSIWRSGDESECHHNLIRLQTRTPITIQGNNHSERQQHVRAKTRQTIYSARMASHDVQIHEKNSKVEQNYNREKLV